MSDRHSNDRRPVARFERDAGRTADQRFGTGYGRSSGYAARPRYVETRTTLLFRCA